MSSGMRSSSSMWPSVRLTFRSRSSSVSWSTKSSSRSLSRYAPPFRIARRASSPAGSPSSRTTTAGFSTSRPRARYTRYGTWGAPPRQPRLHHGHIPTRPIRHGSRRRPPLQPTPHEQPVDVHRDTHTKAQVTEHARLWPVDASGRRGISPRTRRDPKSNDSGPLRW